MRHLLLAAALATPAIAQEQSVVRPIPAAAEAQGKLAWMHGAWAGSGTMFGRASDVRLSVEPALEGKASALTYTAEVKASDKQPGFRFEGRGLYRLDDKGRVTGQWSDSGGNNHAIGGRAEALSMTTVWGSPTTELGRSTYKLDSDGTLSVTDSSLQADGSWRMFATATYRKRAAR